MCFFNYIFVIIFVNRIHIFCILLSPILFSLSLSRSLSLSLSFVILNLLCVKFWTSDFFFAFFHLKKLLTMLNMAWGLKPGNALKDSWLLYCYSICTFLCSKKLVWSPHIFTFISIAAFSLLISLGSLSNRHEECTF